MRVLVVGAGGVGAAVASVAQRRGFFERMVLADVDEARARRAIERYGDERLRAAAVDASDAAAIAELARAEGADTILNAVDPRFNPPIFQAAFDAGCTYLDMAMTLSEPHPERPTRKRASSSATRSSPRTSAGARRAGSRSSASASSRASRTSSRATPRDELFSEIDTIGIRDGANLEVEGYDFAPTFSIWTTIEECLNPPVIWERDRGWYTTEPFSEPEVFVFPEGSAPSSASTSSTRRSC